MAPPISLYQKPVKDSRSPESVAPNHYPPPPSGPPETPTALLRLRHVPRLVPRWSGYAAEEHGRSTDTIAKRRDGAIASGASATEKQPKTDDRTGFRAIKSYFKTKKQTSTNNLQAIPSKTPIGDRTRRVRPTKSTALAGSGTVPRGNDERWGDTTQRTPTHPTPEPTPGKMGQEVSPVHRVTTSRTRTRGRMHM